MRVKVLAIRKGRNWKRLQRTGVRLYAYAASRTRLGITHTITFIRKPGIRRWLCTCEDFIFTQFALGRHCDHIRAVRNRTEVA